MASSIFAPLYAERFQGVEDIQHQSNGGNGATRLAPGGFGNEQTPSRKLTPSSSLTPGQQQTTPPFTRNGGTNTDNPCANRNDDRSPTSTTETSSDYDYNVHPIEGGFEDEPYFQEISSYFQEISPSADREMSSSGREISSSGSLKPVSARKKRQPSEMRLSIDSRMSSTSAASQQRQHQQTQHPPPFSYDDLVKRDNHIKKLMKKLDSMQRRVVDMQVNRECHDLRQMGDNADHVDIEIGGPAAAMSSSHSTSDEEEKQPSPVETKVDGKEPRIGPEAKKLIYKLLNDYEDMERMYKEEKFHHARHIRELELGKSSSAHSNSNKRFAVSTIATEADYTSQVSTQLEPTYAGLRDVLEPKLQEELRFSNSALPTLVRDRFGPTNGISANISFAPDPPEMNASQTQYIHPPFRAFSGQSKKSHRDEEDDDHYSDDLSSRQVNDLIDEDVKSDCKAVKDHSEGRQYWRDIILGVNDGLVSTFLLVAGVRGGGMSSRDILLTAIAGSVAGAVSMCAGEYVATKSQNEVMQGEIAMEKGHIRDYKMDELTEVSDLLELIGIGGEDRVLQKRLIRHYARDPEALLKIMIALELGFLEDEERSPAMAGFVSFFLFLTGAAPSVLPFMVPGIDPSSGFIAAGVATCITLLIVGAVKTWATKGNLCMSAVENLCIAGFGGAIAYSAGLLSNKIMEE